MNFITHLSESERDFLNIYFLDWLINQPNFILHPTEKSQLLSEILEIEKSSAPNIEAIYDHEKKALEISYSEKSYSIISDNLNIYFCNGYYKKFNTFIKVCAFSNKIINSEGINTTIYTLKYSKFLNTLNKLQINDKKAQYIVDEYIESVEAEQVHSTKGN